MLEKSQELNKENGKDDNDELRNIAARFNRMDATLHKISGEHSSSPELLRKPRMRRLPRMNSSLDNRRNTLMF